MAELTVQKPLLTLTTPLKTAASAGGDSFVNTGNEWLILINGGGAPITVTADAANADNFGIIDNAHDNVRVIPAGSERWMGPFPTGRFNDANGKAQLTYSDVTSLTVDVVRSY